MSASQVEIVNVALANLGVELIEDIDENTEQARFAKALWDNCRTSLLRDHPWNFAVDTVELARLVAPAPPDYLYRYQLPADNLRVLSVRDGANLTVQQYRLRGPQLLTDSTRVIISYVKDITDSTQWDALFSDLMAARLAAELAYPLTKSTSSKDLHYGIFQAKQRKARFVDGAEEPSQSMVPTDSHVILNSRY